MFIAWLTKVTFPAPGIHYDTLETVPLCKKDSPQIQLSLTLHMLKQFAYNILITEKGGHLYKAVAYFTANADVWVSV